MTFTPHFVTQRSDAWYQLRIGLLTGSCADAILSVRKRGTGELAKRADLRRRLVAERITGLSNDDDQFISNWMERGQTLEPLAFAAYEAATGQVAQRVGFVTHNTLKTGCSPDGYVGEWEGVLELKVPKSTTHLSYLQAGVLPEPYKAQCLHGIWLTGAKWCDFCSFDPRYPEALELFRVRYTPSDAEIASYELLVMRFLSEVEAEVEALQKRAAVAA